jgi:hypothetical protein
MENTFVLIGEHRDWLTTNWDDLEPGGYFALNRERLYPVRRDFVIQHGDTGKPEEYPLHPSNPG